MTVASVSEVTDFARLLWRPGDVREVRILRAGRYGKGTHSGYFDDPDLIASAIARYDGIVNLYLTANPVAPALLARAMNRIAESVQTTTSDPDVVRRRWIPIDIDPRRPSGISADALEVSAGRETARSIALYLKDAG